VRNGATSEKKLKSKKIILSLDLLQYDTTTYTSLKLSTALLEYLNAFLLVLFRKRQAWPSVPSSLPMLNSILLVLRYVFNLLTMHSMVTGRDTQPYICK